MKLSTHTQKTTIQNASKTQSEKNAYGSSRKILQAPTSEISLTRNATAHKIPVLDSNLHVQYEADHDNPIERDWLLGKPVGAATPIDETTKPSIFELAHQGVDVDVSAVKDGSRERTLDVASVKGGNGILRHFCPACELD